MSDVAEETQDGAPGSDPADEEGAGGAGEAQESPHAKAHPEMSRVAAAARESRGDGLIRVPENDSEMDDLRADAAEGGDEFEEADWEKVTDWLLADEVDLPIRRLDLKVGGSDKKPVFMPWVIKAVPIEVIRQAEREARPNRQARRSRAQQQQQQQYDELRANLRIIVEGTHEPDVKQIATSNGVGDPTELLRKKLAFRPGLIARIAGEILNLSGFDEADLRAAEN